MADSVEILRYSAFSSTPEGGNPAGVVLAADGLSDETMQAIAAEVGFSETAFLTQPKQQGGPFGVRYFSPLAEVGFCGHATIALAVAHAERRGPGRMLLSTKVGRIPVETYRGREGLSARLVSVAPQVRGVDQSDLREALAALRWSDGDLDPLLPARIANAGNDHLVLAARTRERLADLDYDFERLGTLMAKREWTTVQLVWRENESLYHSRNPFPPGGVVEDPATGAAAAALGGYLRALDLVSLPARVTIVQGVDMGRPSTLYIDIPRQTTEGIAVSGTATAIP